VKKEDGSTDIKPVITGRAVPVELFLGLSTWLSFSRVPEIVETTESSLKVSRIVIL